MSDTELIPVANGGEYLEVHPTALANHKELGWAECARREPAVDGDGKSVKLTVADLREQLTAKGIAFDPAASKADLQALFDAQ